MTMSPMTICLLIFVLMIVLFLTNKIPMSFSAMIVLVLLVLTGCIDYKSALSTFGSSTVITMVSMFIVAAGLSRTQMINNLSKLLLRVTGGSFTKILASYVLITFILGQFTPSIVALFAMVSPLVKNMCDQLDISPSKMMYPIAITTVSASFILPPIGPYAADYVVYNGYMESYNWVSTQFTIWTDTLPLLITGVVTMAVAIFIIPKMMPDQPDIPTGMVTRRKRKEQEPLSPVREVLGYGVFAAVIIGLMLGISSWQVTMIGAIVVVVSGVLTEDEAIENMNLDTVMLYVGVVVLGSALSETGAAEMLGNGLAGILGSMSNGYLIGAAFYVVAFLMTSVLYNRAVTEVLYPLAIMTCVAMGVDPRGPIILCNIASMSSLVTPMATAVVPMAMTAGGYSTKTIIKPGLLIALIRGIVCVLVTMTLYPLA